MSLASELSGSSAHARIQSRVSAYWGPSGGEASYCNDKEFSTRDLLEMDFGADLP
jgi:hypothetical protein